MTRTTRQVAKTAAHGRRGMVVAHNTQAAQTGASVLRDGGNAFDAAVAMNGVGGVGVLIADSAETGETSEINFYGRTPAGLSEDVFVPYLHDKTASAFGWKGVEGFRNERGFLFVGVPG